MERFLEITWGPAERQPPLNTLQHSLNGFQPCESFICEASKEIASSCHCKRGNLRHARCNYSHWELPKPTRVAPHRCEKKKKCKKEEKKEEKKKGGRSCRISTAVCGQDFDVASPLSTTFPLSSPQNPPGFPCHRGAQAGGRQRRAPPNFWVWEHRPAYFQISWISLGA